MGLDPSTAYFHINGINLQQAEITGEVLTGRLSSSIVVVHSASYPPGRAIELSGSVPVVVLGG